MNHFREDEVCGSRVMYFREVAKGLAKAPQSFPSSIQAQLYEDALRHLVRAISEKRKEDAAMGGTTPSCRMERGGLKKSRKDALKEIYGLLLCLQRQRLYDPPSDYEIGYYLLMKRYIRSIITFFVSGPEIRMVYAWVDVDDRFDSYRPVRPVHHMEELSELNKHLADLSLFVSQADVRNGSSITPLMGINEKNIEVPPLITGSKDRSNAFYHDKFNLAQLDLRSTEFAHCPPSEEEKRLYVQLIDHLALSSSIPVDEVNVFSDLLCCLFIERVEQEVNDLDKHCMIIKDLILEKLSLTEKYESILEQFKLETEDFFSDYYGEYDPKEYDLKSFYKRKLAQTCRISAKELPDYVKYVGHYQRIVVNVAEFIIRRVSGNDATCDYILDLLKTGCGTEEAGWHFLHALTLIKDGRSLSGTVIQEHSISQILKKRARVEFEKGDECLQKCGNSQKEKDDNLNILRCIVEDLMYIGGLDVKTDDEEKQLLHKIWQNVASSIQFFIAALGYEQRHYIVRCGGLHEVRMPGLRTTYTPRKSRVTIEYVQHKLVELPEEMSNLSFILGALRDGLHERAGGNSD